MIQGAGNGNRHLRRHGFTGPDGRKYVYREHRKLFLPESYSGEDENQAKQDDQISYRDVEIRRDWWAFGVTNLIALATLIIVATYTFYAARQVAASEDSNSASRQALRESGRGLGLTLSKLQAQIAESQKQTRSFGRSADATASAANTSIQALHISERAYIEPGPATIDFALFRLGIHILNTGHIPSGGIHGRLYEEVSQQSPGQHLEVLPDVDERWETIDFDSLYPNQPSTLSILAPRLNKQAFQSGDQIVVIILDLSYNDGFPKTQENRVLFCARSFFDPDVHYATLALCPSEFPVEERIRGLGVPKNEDKTP